MTPIPSGLPAIIKAYGNPLAFADRTDEWERAVLTYGTLVTPLPYAYGDATITRIRAHRLIVDELVGLLADAAAIVQALGLPLDRIAYGGCYIWRAKRGGTKLSTHTWGISVDLDPARNKQGQPHNPGTGLPMPVADLFRHAGWTWGGDWSGKHCDPMHAQRCASY